MIGVVELTHEQADLVEKVYWDCVLRLLIYREVQNDLEKRRRNKGDYL